MKTFFKHILPFLLGAAVGIAPCAFAADYIRFADMTGATLVPTTNKIEAINAQIEEVAGEVIAGLPNPFEVGGTANLARGMGLLAWQARVPVVPLVMRRTAWRRFEVEFFPILRADPAAPRDEEELRLTREVVARFDEAIRRDPGQWFWYNRRWVLDPVQPGA